MAVTYGRGLAATTSDSFVVIVPTPPDGTKRLIGLVTYSNKDVINHYYAISLYDGSNHYWVANNIVNVANHISLPSNGSGYTLLPGDSLWGKLIAATDTNEGDFTAHWCDEIAEGEDEG